MAEYIDRDAVYTAFANACTDVLERASEIYYIAGFSYEHVIEILDDIPAADVAPVVHGRWDDSGRYTFPSGNTAVRCTNCGCALTESEYRLNNWNYCPVCGARMDGGDSDETD